MKTLYALTLFLLCNFNLLAQSPSFTGQPTLIGGFVCYGNDAQISASTASADVYQLQIQDGGSGTWSDYGGITGAASSGSILITLSNYTLSNNFRIRITNNTSGDTNFSDEFFIDAQRPQLTIQPADQIRCFGERVYFYVDDNPAWTYTWERSDNGGAFGAFSGSKYQDQTTSSFNINTVNTNDNNDAFRVRVTDSDGCETLSESGLLNINSFGTIQPTTSTQFCEGEEASFSTSIVGNVDSYSWNFYNGLGANLTVNPSAMTAEGITIPHVPADLDKAELVLTFVSQIMNPDGSTTATTCDYTRDRSAYTTYDRPEPLAAEGDSICGPGDVTLYVLSEICGTYEWYADTTASPVASGPFEYDFTPTGLTATTNYYVRYVDCDTDCPSGYTTVEAKVNPLPSVVLGTIEAVCPDAISFSIPLTSLADADSFQVTLTSGILTGYTDASGYISGNSIVVPLPASKSSGNYGFDLKLFNTITGCESTVSLSLRIKEPTVINSALSPQTLCEGDVLTLNADSSGEGTLSYQWFFEGSEIPGATGASYSIPSVLTTNAGNYHYTATGECGTATATAAAITVNAQTKINTQPQSQEVCLGADATFTVSATGFGTLSYQWKKDGADVGTDSPTLILSGVLATDDGAEITCVVTGGCGDSTSALAILTVLSLPSAPAVSDTGFCQNSTADPLEAVGLHTLNWYGMNATGGTASATAPTPSTTTVGVFSYYVSQTDTKGCESARAKLDVIIDPELTTTLSSSSRDVCAFGNLNKTVLFTVTASGGTGSFTYQWGKSGANLPGENGTEYTGTGSGNYFVTVTSGSCDLTKDLTINTVGDDLTPPPSVTANGEAVPYAFCPGSSVSLVATDQSGVSGTTLNWYVNGTTNVILQSGNPLDISGLTKDTVFYVSASATYGLLTCESDRSLANLLLSPPPSATADIVNESCAGAADGSITLTPGTNFLPYSFQLDAGSPQAFNFFDGLTSGTYTVTLQDANGCTATQSVVVGENPPLSFDYGPNDQTNCKGNVVYFESQPSIDVPQQWFKKLPGGVWQLIDGETETRLRVSSIGNSANPAGTFYRTVIGTGVCAVSSDSAELFVNEFTANLDNQTACEGDVVTFQPPTSTGDIIEYEWQKRIGTTGSWNAIQTGSSPDYVIAAASAADDNTYYRVKLTFFNPNETTCTETSDQGKLDVTVINETTLNGSTEICQGESTALTATGCNGTVEWSDAQTGESIDVSPTSTTTYTANCVLDGCSEAAVNSVVITVKPGVAAPVLSASVTELCFGESAQLSAEGCLGEITWSTGENTANITVSPTSSTKYSAVCVDNGCTSPAADSLEILGTSELLPGEIAENLAINCAGYNPPTIQSVSAPSGGKGVLTIQWEMSEGCSASPVVWSEITGENGETYNPSTIYQTTCYRRKVTDECDAEVYSNTVTIEIVDDPTISVTSSADSVCSAEPFTLTAEVRGGTGTCYTSWQQNLRSSAPTSSYWKDISGDVLTNTISDAVNSTTEPVSFYYRAIYDCELTNCNKATSEAVEVVVLPSNEVALNLSDTTVCAGNSVELAASSCGGTLLWSDGFTGAVRTIIAAVDADPLYSVTCSGQCGSYSATARINVISGLPLPVNTTPATVIQPDTLFFSAEGTNLQWYSADHPDSSLSGAPSEFEVGEYTYWVSQSDEVCTSPRLQISARVYPRLKINVQAYDQYDCEGNSVTFSMDVEGAGNISYQWQRKRPGEIDFTNLKEEDDGIKNVNYPDLKVSAVGDNDNPNLSMYRCLITDSVSYIVSEARILYANTLDGTLPNVYACLGTDFEIKLKDFIRITGDVLKYQWQVRDDILGKWFDLEEKGNISGTKTDILKFHQLNYENSRKYRCRVYFVTGGFECIESTDQTILYIGEEPIKPADQVIEYCQGETTKLLLYDDDIHSTLWYSSPEITSVGTSKRPKPSSEVAGEFIWYFSVVSNKVCASPKAKYTITIHPEPEAPHNRTPSVVQEGDSLVFAASGENLTWYLTRTGKNFELDVPPTFTEVDFYDYYVSQTSEFGCESPRTYIAAEIRGTLGFKADVENLADCEGNSVRFRANAKGIPPFAFQWERKRPDETEFTLLEGETEDELLVSDIGSSTNPHLSEYRVILTDSTRESVVSNAAVLYVNKVEGSIPDQTFCEGAGIRIDTSGLLIQGEIVLIELQKQVGRSWVSLAESQNFNFAEIPADSLTEGDFRLRFTFAAERGATCARSTSEFKINLAQQPESPGAINQTVCQYGSLDLPILRSLTYRWYNAEQELIDVEELTQTSGENQLFYCSWVNIAGCESNLDSVRLNVLEAPVLFIEDTLFTFCRFAPQEQLSISDTADYNWYLDSLLTMPLDEAPLIETAEVGTPIYWVTYTGENGCGSLPAKVTVQVEECFLGTGDADCQELAIEEVSGNDWLYFFTNTGEIVLAIHPQGQNLGRVVLNYRQTASSDIETPLGTVYLPRYFDLNSENEFTEPVLIRAYYQNSEIEDYLGTVEDEEFNGGLFQIVHYEGINEDCYIENNDNFEEGQSWVINADQDLLVQNDDFSYFEFALSSFSEIGFTSNPFAKLASFESNSQEKSALMRWQKQDEVRPLEYFLEKSANGEDWVIVGSFSSTDPAELTDYLPLQNESFYRLVYQDADGTRKLIGEVDLRNTSTETSCFTYPNPFIDYQNVNLYLANIEPVEVRVFDILGKEYPVEIQNGDGLNQKIDFPSDMMEGVYILEILGKDEKTCRWKMVRQKRN